MSVGDLPARLRAHSTGPSALLREAADRIEELERQRPESDGIVRLMDSEASLRGRLREAADALDAAGVAVDIVREFVAAYPDIPALSALHDQARVWVADHPKETK